jgi:hypothetical protein
LCLDRKKRGGEKRERVKERRANRKKYQDPEGVPLEGSFHSYAGPSAKTREAWVDVGGRA